MTTDELELRAQLHKAQLRIKELEERGFTIVTNNGNRCLRAFIPYTAPYGAFSAVVELAKLVLKDETPSCPPTPKPEKSEP
jgi:hypothetical protein